MVSFYLKKYFTQKLFHIKKYFTRKYFTLENISLLKIFYLRKYFTLKNISLIRTQDSHPLEASFPHVHLKHWILTLLLVDFPKINRKIHIWINVFEHSTVYRSHLVAFEWFQCSPLVSWNKIADFICGFNLFHPAVTVQLKSSWIYNHTELDIVLHLF